MLFLIKMHFSRKKHNETKEKFNVGFNCQNVTAADKKSLPLRTDLRNIRFYTWKKHNN